MVTRLPDTLDIRRIESRLVSLVERTFLKGALRTPGPRIIEGVNRAFRSKTYEFQLDQIIDDIFRVSCAYADRVVGKPPSIYASLLPWPRGRPVRLAAAVRGGPYPLTEDLVRKSTELSAEAAEAIVRMLQDEGIYQLHPNQLEKRVRDLFGGQKYKAVRFCRTVTADIATNTAVRRYADQGIEYLQFYAKIDDKTTPQCRMFHGTVFSTKGGDAKQYRPPLHHNCRSDLLPVPGSYKIDENLMIENRDFTRHYGQDFEELGIKTDIDQMSKTFERIDKFNQDWRISRFVLDEDTELRLMKLNLSIEGVPPKSLPKKPEPPKPGPAPEPIKEPDKPKYLKGSEVREKAKAIEEKNRAAILKKASESGKLDGEIYLLSDKYETISKRLAKNIEQGIIKEGSPEYLAVMKTREEILKQISEKTEQYMKLSEEMEKLKQKSKDVYKKLLYIDDGPKRKGLIKLDSTGAGPASRKKEVKEAQEFINRVVAQKYREKVPDIEIVEQFKGFRPNAELGNRIINMEETYHTDTIIHEWGHHLEHYNPELYQSGETLYARRTQGEQARKLSDITGNMRYKDNEVAKPDNFFNPYFGKTYGDNVGYSERVSMGIQELYSNPARLAEKDPETFDWIVDTLRGNT